MRAPSTVSDESANPSFLRTIVTKKLRTEWSCHPVALIIPAIVVPLRCLSRARTVSCLVLPRLKAVPTFLRFAVLVGRVVDAMFVRMLLCDMMRSLRLRRHMRRHRRSPTMAKSPAGRDPRPIGPASTLTPMTLCLQQKSSRFCRKYAPAGVNVSRLLSEVGLGSVVESNECASRCLSSHQVAVACT